MEREESTFKCHSRKGISNQANLNKEESRVQMGRCEEKTLIEPSDGGKLKKKKRGLNASSDSDALKRLIIVEAFL